MLAFQNALTSWFAASVVAPSFPGGFWDSQAPENVRPMYVVYTVIAAPRTASYGSAYYQPLIQFCAFGTDKDVTGQAMESFVALLDAQIFTLTSGQTFDNRRTTEPVADLMPTTGQGQPVWRWRADYQFSVRS